jgi:hypothetical protein
MLVLPQGEGFELVNGTAEQPVPPPPQGAVRRTSPVTWKVKAGPREGTYSIKGTSAGVTQTLPIKIKVRNIFGSN